MLSCQLSAKYHHEWFIYNITPLSSAQCIVLKIQSVHVGKLLAMKLPAIIQFVIVKSDD